MQASKCQILFFTLCWFLLLCAPVAVYIFHRRALARMSVHRKDNHTRGLTRSTVPVDVAVGLGLTSKGFSPESALDQYPFFNTFLKTLCATASPKYNYAIYIAYDYDDPILSSPERRANFTSKVAKTTCRGAPAAANANANLNATCGRADCSRLSLPIYFVCCNYSGKPAWAQNDAMMAAYHGGAKYLYRVNDDTAFLTEGWPENFISILASYDPPNVGVVGPQDVNRPLDFPLTYDFVHRTHVGIFGFYYPRDFDKWFADFWIDNVYRPTRTVIDRSTRLRHDLYMVGTRYVPDQEHGGLTLGVVTRYKQLLDVRLRNVNGTLVGIVPARSYRTCARPGIN